MTLKTIAPYGEWKSEITADTVISGSRPMSSIRVCGHSGRAFFKEARPDGTNGIVEITSDGLNDVLSISYSAQSRVYEYGGAPYAVMPNGRIIFSNAKDSSVNVLNVDSGEVSRLVAKLFLRYSNFDAYPGDQPWVLAIEEDHERDTPDSVKNYIVAINTKSSEVKRVVSGADFYYDPHFSLDGSKISWLQWNHPDLPFSSAQLFCANWSSDASPSNIVVVAGKNRDGVAEPRWGPDGTLFFGQEVDGFRQLFRLIPGDSTASLISLVGLENGELGEISWLQGSRTYVPLSSKFLAASCIRYGSSTCILIDIETGNWTDLKLPAAEIKFDSMERLSETSFLVIGSGATTPPALYKVEVGETTAITTVRESANEKLSPSIFSVPEHICVPAKGSPKREIHGFFWAPHNPKYEGPNNKPPPLILQSHGGPTSYTSPGLKLTTQYFTSRGFAYFSLNYTGSSGHGRDYREALFGNWGIVDADDAAECVQYLSATGRINGAAVGITGGSAGGYNVLQALVQHPTLFAGGVCICGVSSIKQLGEKTHKLESKYVDALVLRPGMSEEEKEKVMHERSPVYHAGNIASPLLWLHGSEDTVVPIEQAMVIEKAIKEKGGDVKLVIVPGEGHMFGRPQSQLVWLREEEQWWRKTLLKK
ncbi:alpha/beta-hydrolase [Zopfia rhizophila CBS 207.26]|uniref:Alpha/beta-hydrolase n=1 Tax=Zopfia rhizophila CBS 207.26 TaxID=1314779 RepID=A0A6A6DB40_9PEZI|nr:alpha/beta-hydrolase [Zopfia rhizophila CBS 207.26]